MISRTADYALRAVTYLAANVGEPRTTQQIAEVTKVPAGYLSKVLKSLARHGLTQSQRGLYGGYRLTRDPDGLRVIEVIDAIGPIRRITECPLGLTHPGGPLCPVHRLLDDAMAHVESELSRVTIGDLTRAGDQPIYGKSSERTGALCPLRSMTPATGDAAGEPPLIETKRKSSRTGADSP